MIEPKNNPNLNQSLLGKYRREGIKKAKNKNSADNINAQ